MTTMADTADHARVRDKGQIVAPPDVNLWLGPQGRPRAPSQFADKQYSLARIAIFAGLPTDGIKRIERRCAWRRYQPGEPIVNYLDASDDVFFISVGEVRVTIYASAGKAVSFRELRAGEIFGEYPAIDRGPRSARVEARTNCLIASMSGRTFRELVATEPGLAQALLPLLVRTIRALNTRVFEFSTLAVNNRIQAELLRLAGVGSRQGNSARIVPTPTHVEMASRVSTHREAVTRELNRLTKIGIIERRGGTLLVKDLDCLGQMVQDATGDPFRLR